MGFGADKYGRDNWRLGLHYSRLIDAALRHVLALADGEDVDPESGLLHAAHARACLGMLISMPSEWDDRRPPELQEAFPVRQADSSLPKPTAVPPVRSGIPSKRVWTSEPSCLDAAYERQAIENGSVFKPVFPENQT